MKPAIENPSPVRRHSFATVAVVGLLALCALMVAQMSFVSAADAASYPVRLCSPEYRNGDGTSQNTFNPGYGAGTRTFTKTAGGSLNYGALQTSPSYSWSLLDVAVGCGTANSSNSTISDFGIPFFSENTGLIQKGEEAGVEFAAPAGEKIQQISLNGKAVRVNDPSSPQQGISNGGTKLKWDFITPQGESKTWTPTQNWGDLNGFSANAPQASQALRLGLICDPASGATICIGGIGRTAVVNDIQLTLDDPAGPAVNIGSTPMTNGAWVDGSQNVSFTAQDSGSGLRETQVYIDDNLVNTKTYSCNLVPGTFGPGTSNLLVAKNYDPCPQALQSETISIDTTRFGDGTHTLKVCARDYAMAVIYWKTAPASPSCKSTPVQIDNTAPAAPEQAAAISTRIPRSVNPYDVSWDNPGTGDAGSPIHEVTYSIKDQSGNTVVSETNTDNGSDSQFSASNPLADNITHVPYLDTPLGSGEFTLQMRLIDEVGHISKVTDVPLSYSCENSGGDPLPSADIAMGLVESGQATETATEFLALDQGEKSTVVGKVRGPGQMPINGADVCINAKPVVDPQLQLLSSVDTNGNGNFTDALPPGPSRTMLTVFRQGHRETWSDPVSTQVTVQPTLSTTLKGNYSSNTKVAKVRSGKVAWFKGVIPGPYADKVVVVLQGKPAGTSDKNYRAFRRYRTRYGGRFKMRNVFYNTSKTGKKAYLKIRAQVRNQVGYPYHEGDSNVMTLVVLPKKKKHCRCSRLMSSKTGNCRANVVPAG